MRITIVDNDALTANHVYGYPFKPKKSETCLNVVQIKSRTVVKAVMKLCQFCFNCCNLLPHGCKYDIMYGPTVSAYLTFGPEDILFFLFFPICYIFPYLHRKMLLFQPLIVWNTHFNKLLLGGKFRPVLQNRRLWVQVLVPLPENSQ